MRRDGVRLPHATVGEDIKVSRRLVRLGRRRGVRRGPAHGRDRCEAARLQAVGSQLSDRLSGDMRPSAETPPIKQTGLIEKPEIADPAAVQSARAGFTRLQSARIPGFRPGLQLVPVLPDAIECTRVFAGHDQAPYQIDHLAPPSGSSCRRRRPGSVARSCDRIEYEGSVAVGVDDRARRAPDMQPFGEEEWFRQLKRTRENHQSTMPS